MNSINSFMTDNLPKIKESIINQLPRPFDSHAFIKKFSKEFQVEYVQYLAQYDKDPFENVHSQIGRFLSDKHIELGIKSIGRITSENIFGILSENENWN